MLDRRSLFSRLAAGLAVGAASLPAAAAAPPVDKLPIPEDLDPKYEEAWRAVGDFERYGGWVLYSPHLGVGFGHVDGLGREPMTVRLRLSRCDQHLLAEFLQITGRVERAAQTEGFLIPDDMEATPRGLEPKHMNARFKAVRELVDAIERAGYSPLHMNGQFYICDPSDRWDNPNELLSQLRACNRDLVNEYLVLTGRVSPGYSANHALGWQA